MAGSCEELLAFTFPARSVSCASGKAAGLSGETAKAVKKCRIANIEPQTV